MGFNRTRFATSAFAVLLWGCAATKTPDVAGSVIARNEISSHPKWVATDSLVNKGDVVDFRATGVWVDFYIPCGANGYPAGLFYWLKQFPRIDDNGRYFRLMGRVGDPNRPPSDDDRAATFVIGTARTVTLDRSGRIYVFANDKKNMYWNNWGHVNLTISLVSATDTPAARGAR